MRDVLITAGLHLNDAKRSLGEMLILSEHNVGMAARLRVRKLVDLFQFRLGLFLLRLDEGQSPVPFGQFVYWYPRLAGSRDPTGVKIIIEDNGVAFRCLQAITESEASLVSAAALLLSNRVPRAQRVTDPINAIVGAKEVLDRMKSEILSTCVERLPVESSQDQHIWTYLSTVTTVSFPWND